MSKTMKVNLSYRQILDAIGSMKTDEKIAFLRDLCIKCNYNDSRAKVQDLERMLEEKSQSLAEAYTALKVLLKHREEDRATIEEQLSMNLKTIISPYLIQLKNTDLNDKQMAYLEIIENQIHDIKSPFVRTFLFSDLTPREIQIAFLVKEGKTTQEITDLLNISAKTCDFHRKNLRKKFGIVNNKTNLRSYLASLSE